MRVKVHLNLYIEKIIQFIQNFTLMYKQTLYNVQFMFYAQCTMYRPIFTISILINHTIHFKIVLSCIYKQFIMYNKQCIMLNVQFIHF